MDKFEFASPAWIAALKDLLAIYTKKAGNGLELSICEVFTNVPKHLDKHGTGVIAWHCLIKDGKVHFEETAIPEADVRRRRPTTRSSFPSPSKVYTPEVMPEVDAYIAKGAAEGKMKSTSTRPHERFRRSSSACTTNLPCARSDSFEANIMAKLGTHSLRGAGRAAWRASCSIVTQTLQRAGHPVPLRAERSL